MRVLTYIHKGKVKTVSLDDLRKMKVELTQQWEDLCQKCGKCCFDKSISNNGTLVIDYNKPCQFLKYIGRKAECTTYFDRFAKCEKCHTIPEAIQNRLLPADCPYVKSVASYKAPVDNGDWFKRARVKLSRYDDEGIYTGADMPTGGTRNMPAKLPPRITALEAQNLTREDLGKPKDWKRRRLQQKQRVSGGKQGIVDPREKTTYDIKPTGHAGAG